LRVQIGGQWYSAKLESGLTAADVGKNVTFILGDTPFPPGSTNYWINDYTFTDAATSPATQAMDTAMAQQPYSTGEAPGTRSGQSPPVGHPAAVHTEQAVKHPMDAPAKPNKDAMIGAMALTKSFVYNTESIIPQTQEIWDAFTWFYHKLNNWNPQDDPPYV